MMFDPGDNARNVQLGQTSRTPRGTKDGIKINLPTKVITLAQPHSGATSWFSGNDQDWADVKLARTFDVPEGDDVRFWLWNNYVIEADWDFGFIEVTTDGGATWTELKVFDETGALVSTDDGYPDPNGRMHDYGDKKYGLTGDSHGWRHDYVDLSAYAGQSIGLRLRYATDAGFLERGWFADDFSVTADGATVWSDDSETDGDWVAELGTFTNTSGVGWTRDTGTRSQAHYFLAEWRNLDSFDAGLQYAYDTNYLHDAWEVERVPYNAPGMLVWYRDTTYGGVNHVTLTTTHLPSTGSKGGLLIVDSHFDPFRRQGVAADKDPSTLNNIPSRPQSSNAAFGLIRTNPFTECYENLPTEPFSEYCTDFGSQAPVSRFNSNLGWYPGLELRPNGADVFFRDIDASVVMPSVGNANYSVRFVDSNGNPLPQFYGLDLGVGSLLGTGNPGDEGVGFGVRISIVNVAKNNTYATVRVVPVD